MSISRRNMCLLLPATLIPGCLRPEGLAAQEGSMPSAMYPFEKLPIRTPNNAQVRNVLKGKLATGESLEVHETILPPGGAPHAAHHHVHSEMWLIREGTVELTVNGKSCRLGPGSVGFVHSNDDTESRMWAQRQRHILWWLWAPARVLDGRRNSARQSRCWVRSGVSTRIQYAARLPHSKKISQ
ncbi:MAG TPA: cupin domain-containing protein [Candidatus Dormibacteraeota bacterium]|nr:cupin domain-containing protein [Candidatus Dormibacteraeota bacterium]